MLISRFELSFVFFFSAFNLSLLFARLFVNMDLVNECEGRRSSVVEAIVFVWTSMGIKLNVK